MVTRDVGIEVDPFRLGFQFPPLFHPIRVGTSTEEAFEVFIVVEVGNARKGIRARDYRPVKVDVTADRKLRIRSIDGRVDGCIAA